MPTCFPTTCSSWTAELSGLIDFYFAATDILTYDVAVCLNAWCFEPDFSFNVTKARAMLRAYDATRPLSDAERAALPVLCQGAAIRFLLTRLYDWLNTPPGALVTRKEPLDYLRRLRFHLARARPSTPMASEQVTVTPGPPASEVVEIWTDGGCQAESRGRRLGGDPAVPRRGEGIVRCRAGDHQQPHGTDRGGDGAGDTEAAVPRGAAHRQRIREERRHALARGLGAAQLAQRRRRSGGEHGPVAAAAGGGEGAPDRVALGARAFRRSDERAGGQAGDGGAGQGRPSPRPGSVFAARSREKPQGA